MLSNLHTHTTFCDGNSTAEEVVLTAIKKGFHAIGFSGHGYTEFDVSYCMKDTMGYMAAVRELHKRYGSQIEIYLGVEEDAAAPVPNRADFDYIIGSSHYLKRDGRYYPIDSSPDGFCRCMEMFDGDPLKLAEAYYHALCEYILARKPDIIGHFDLITKYDERESLPFSNNIAYQQLAKRYLLEALKSGCFFEVNTGAMARGYRTSPYPAVSLLHTLKEQGGKVVLSSDCHNAADIDYGFKEARVLLRDIGFEYVYTLSKGEFTKKYL